MYDYTLADLFKMAGDNTLPRDFDQWSLADETGWTLAHTAAACSHLPEDFNQWNLANKTGWSVAHVAVQFYKLPKKFDGWSIATNDGWSVAHAAAQNGHLPKGFHKTHPDIWKLKSIFGTSVEDLAQKSRYVVD